MIAYTGVETELGYRKKMVSDVLEEQSNGLVNKNQSSDKIGEEVIGNFFRMDLREVNIPAT